MTTVLVLDDREANRELMAAVLGYAGYTVQTASTGLEALELAHARPPDLIVADILMPEMDGYEFVHALRRDPAVKDVRVMFCTATYAEDEVRRLAAACGVSHLLFKPCDAEQILAAVKAALVSEPESVHALPAEDFRERLRVLNGKLVEKIAQLEESERQAAESHMLLETLASSAPVGFGFMDRDFRILRINDTLAAVNGIPAEQQLGRTTAELMPDLWPQLEPLYRQVLDSGEPVLNAEVEGEAPSTKGDRRCWLVSLYPVPVDDAVIGIGVVVLDITDRRNSEDLRVAVMDNLSEGVVVSDIEGRLVYMNASAARMLGWRQEDVKRKPCHPILHPQKADAPACDVGRCELVAVRLESGTVRNPDDVFTRKDGTLFPVAYSAAPLRTGHTLSGSVIVFRDISEEKAEQLKARRELEALTWVGRTRDALEEERLVLYSQPIVPTHGGEASEELLIRMIGRDGEIIPPARFLPVAEKYGLIGDIDRWVIKRAIEFAAAGRHVEANLSAQSIGDLGLLRLIEKQFRETGADPSFVVFEITETALMENMEAGEAFVSGLAAIGAGVALDDFGTGFGSFTYLKRLPIQFLKIDIDFVRDLTSPNSANRHLVKAIVGLAGDFGYKTIAEGVEDEETLLLLEELGVDMAQGFYLGHPEPTEPVPPASRGVVLDDARVGPGPIRAAAARRPAGRH